MQWMIVLLLWLGGPCLADEVVTSTRYIHSLTVEPDGQVWAASGGGVLHRTADGTWRRFTRAHGLPSHEVMQIWRDARGVAIRVPQSVYRMHDDRWIVDPTATAPSRVVLPHGAGLPPGLGSHVSAVVQRSDTWWAALYGDGLWEYDGQQWTSIYPDLPVDARDITALSVCGPRVWIGTRRHGMWEQTPGGWQQHLQPDEPYDHNCQALLVRSDELYLSTLEDGLQARIGGRWSRLMEGTPRHLASVGGAVFVRTGPGELYRIEDGRIEKVSLPRREAFALEASQGRLLVAQWGGWSEFDGQRWTHHMHVPALQGYGTTAITAGPDSVYIGTQKRGLLEIRRNGETLWHDETTGMPDDWITAIARTDDGLFAGTFVGGLARLQNGRWKTFPELSGVQVTALVPSPSGLLVGTRRGLYRLTHDRLTRLLDEDVQAVTWDGTRIWVGSRTGVTALK